jgi:hypothetical protein
MPGSFCYGSLELSNIEDTVMNKVIFAGQRLFMKFPTLDYFEPRMPEVDAQLVCVRTNTPTRSWSGRGMPRQWW